ncbi:putative PAS domain S-box protein [Gammaproteobacteria bacterium]
MNRQTAPPALSISPLRAEAEAVLASVPATRQKELANDSPANLLHELQVHQLELEMQNDELRKIQTELEASRDRYLDLYEFAPIGYLTVNREGLIVEINLTAVMLLGVDRDKLMHRRLAQFVVPQDQGCWYRLFLSVVQRGGKQSGEFSFQRGDGLIFHARLDCQPEAGGETSPRIRIALSDISEQKRIEELRIAATAFQSREGMLVTDANNVILRVNRAFTHITGYTSTEVIGKTPRILQSGRHPADFYTAMWECIHRTGAWEGEIWSQRKNGEVYPTYATITLVKDRDGITTNHVGTFTDITERKAAEEALRDSEARLALTLASTELGAWDLDIKTGHVIFNERWAEMRGYRLKDIERNISTWTSGIHPDDFAAMYTILMEHFSNHLPLFQAEYRVRTQSGAWRWIMGRGAVTRRDAEGKPLRMAGVEIDITAQTLSAQRQRALVEELQRRADEIFDLYNNAPCGYHSIDKDGVFQRINDTELKWLGYSREEVIGRMNISTLLTPTALLTFQRNFPQFKEIGEIRYLEMELIRKDGTILPVLIGATALYHADGSFLMSRTTVYDITERKEMEQERTNHTIQLEEKSRRLVAVQEDARRVLSMELHDRTSPNLAAIALNLDIIARGLAEQPSMEFVVRMEDTRALLADTATSIREVCADLRPAVLDYAGLLAAMKSYSQQFSRRTGIVIEIDCTQPEVRLAPDLESLLFRIFQEALTNCAKHAQATSLMITLRHGNHPIVLTIIDDGVGFDPVLLWQRPMNGLGIINMREMITFVGGILTLESQPGKGTSITVGI